MEVEKEIKKFEQIIRENEEKEEELRTALKELRSKISSILPPFTIYDVDIEDTTEAYTERNGYENIQYKLAFSTRHKKGLCVRLCYSDGYKSTYDIDDIAIPWEALKALVLRLPEFLLYVSEELQKRTQEYAEVAAVAAKMAASVV